MTHSRHIVRWNNRWTYTATLLFEEGVVWHEETHNRLELPPELATQPNEVVTLEIPLVSQGSRGDGHGCDDADYIDPEGPAILGGHTLSWSITYRLMELLEQNICHENEQHKEPE